MRHRTTRVMALTEKGERYRHQIALLLAAMEEVESLLRPRQQQWRGRVHIQLPLAAKALQSGKLVRMLSDWRLPDRFLYAVFPDARFISWRVRRIVQLIETVLEDWPGVAFSS